MICRITGQSELLERSTILRRSIRPPQPVRRPAELHPARLAEAPPRRRRAAPGTARPACSRASTASPRASRTPADPSAGCRAPCPALPCRDPRPDGSLRPRRPGSTIRGGGREDIGRGDRARRGPGDSGPAPAFRARHLARRTRHEGAPHADRDPHQRIPPLHLRGRRGPRRVPHAGAGPDRGRAPFGERPLLRRPGRPAGEPDRPRGRPRVQPAVPRPEAQEVQGDDAPGPGHGGDAGRRGRGPLPHLVHPSGRLPGPATDRRAAGPHDALARAPPPLEGRATRQSLPRQLVGREDRLPERRRGRRRLRVDAARRAHALRRPLRARSGSSTTGST